MNTETIGYSILAAILGIVIVLLALFVFDLVMVALTKIFAEKKSGKEIAGARKNGQASAASETTPANAAPGKEDLGWLFAAVAAYLADSEEETAPLSVLSWQPNPAETCNPWILAPHVNHTWTGVR